MSGVFVYIFHRINANPANIRMIIPMIKVVANMFLPQPLDPVVQTAVPV